MWKKSEVVSKPIRNWAIYATLDHFIGWILSLETGYIYAINEPQQAFSSWIAFCPRILQRRMTMVLIKLSCFTLPVAIRIYIFPAFTDISILKKFYLHYPFKRWNLHMLLGRPPIVVCHTKIFSLFSFMMTAKVCFCWDMNLLYY